MSARSTLYFGLISRAQKQDTGLNSFIYHPLATPDKIMTRGHADDVVSVALEAGQKPSEALQLFIQNHKPQYKKGWIEKTVVPSFISDKPPLLKERTRDPIFQK